MQNQRPPETLQYLRHLVPRAACHISHDRVNRGHGDISSIATIICNQPEQAFLLCKSAPILKVLPVGNPVKTHANTASAVKIISRISPDEVLLLHVKGCLQCAGIVVIDMKKESVCRVVKLDSLFANLLAYFKQTWRRWGGSKDMDSFRLNYCIPV